MSKPFKRYLVTSHCPTPTARYTSATWRRLYPVGHLHALPAPERIRRDLGLRQRRARRAHHHQGPQRGVTPQQIVDRYHQLIKSSFEGLGMSFDIYSRTSSKTHAATASEFFRKLYDEGKFIERTSSNTTTRKPRRSSPTAISWAPAPAAATTAPTATNAKNADRPFRRTN